MRKISSCQTFFATQYYSNEHTFQKGCRLLNGYLFPQNTNFSFDYIDHTGDLVTNSKPSWNITDLFNFISKHNTNPIRLVENPFWEYKKKSAHNGVELGELLLFLKRWICQSQSQYDLHKRNTSYDFVWSVCVCVKMKGQSIVENLELHNRNRDKREVLWGSYKRLTVEKIRISFYVFFFPNGSMLVVIFVLFWNSNDISNKSFKL